MCAVPQKSDETNSSYSIYKDRPAYREVEAKICLAHESQVNLHTPGTYGAILRTLEPHEEDFK